eukprot:Plantae.Rhodophyta-Hildenbrandia_rubra.ctg25912.p1 GENE.Plantae.Rhodophyta-Hildenbrandia_rubra.ctg25912~~Plantae.Rhodophyta-Hildenbrandia_rubra.ctg25912.p1  ORF type:complete len:797 (+),score=181.35 Plantae.Rhodophyta-Hildenbrandia_rubra.ctg25912:32-2422(+)
MAARVGRAASHVERIQIRLAAHNLANLDIVTKSDPFAVVYLRQSDNTTTTNPSSNPWIEIGRTETVWDSLNPQWTTAFDVPYVFEQLQEVKVDVYDRDAQKESLDRHDFIGGVECAMAQIVTSPGGRLMLGLLNERKKRRGLKRDGGGKDVGFLVFMAESIKAGNRTFYLDLGLRLFGGGKGGGDSIRRYFRIFRARDDGFWMPVYTSERTRSCERKLRWKSVVITSQSLNGGDDSTPLRIEFYDHRNINSTDGQGVMYSSITTTYESLKALDCGTELEVGKMETNQKKGMFSMCLPKGAPEQFVKKGALIVYSCREVKEHTFLDYIAGGCRINLSVAVDFTSSNGDPRKPNTLHYQAPDDPDGLEPEPNEYEAAIRAVTGTLSYYIDEPQKYPCYGFGARVPPDYNVSHCFPLGGDAVCEGIEGIIASYRQTLKEVQLFGPTCFSDVVAQAGRLADEEKVTQDNQSYTVLLILTDGVVSDIKQTIAEIVGASVLPLSIVIVGIGDEDFGRMKLLDGDHRLLRIGDREALRDIVQFVSFRAAEGDLKKLARQVLEEIPSQLLGFMQYHNIRPNPPKQNSILTDLGSTFDGRDAVEAIAHMAPRPAQREKRTSKDLRSNFDSRGDAYPGMVAPKPIKKESPISMSSVSEVSQELFSDTSLGKSRRSRERARAAAAAEAAKMLLPTGASQPQSFQKEKRQDTNTSDVTDKGEGDIREEKEHAGEQQSIESGEKNEGRTSLSAPTPTRERSIPAVLPEGQRRPRKKKSPRKGQPARVVPIMPEGRDPDKPRRRRKKAVR